MKKVILFVILIIGYCSVSIGQTTGRPCAEYDNYRDILDMKQILMSDGNYYQCLRNAYAEAINRGVGKNVVTSTKEGMNYILDNTVLVDVDFVVPSDYYNGVRYGDNIKWTTLTGQPSDKWAAFSYEGVEYVYAKPSCMNPQKPKKPGIYVKENTEPKPDLNLSASKDEWKYIEPQKTAQPTPYIPPVNVPKEGKKIKIGYIVIPLAAILVGTATYFLLQKSNDHPGGAPVIPPVDNGGPGGAPPTSYKLNYSW